MEFIKKVFKPKTNKHYYYVYRNFTKNKKQIEEFVRVATIDEIKAFNSDKSRDDNLTIMVCDNPHCETIFKVTKQEKILFNLIEPRDKKKLQFQYCSAKCREEHGEELRG
jgi:hypothetical protein